MNPFRIKKKSSPKGVFSFQNFIVADLGFQYFPSLFSGLGV